MNLMHHGRVVRDVPLQALTVTVRLRRMLVELGAVGHTLAVLRVCVDASAAHGRYMTLATRHQLRSACVGLLGMLLCDAPGRAALFTLASAGTHPLQCSPGQ